MLLFALVFPDGQPLGRAWSWALLGLLRCTSRRGASSGSVDRSTGVVGGGGGSMDDRPCPRSDGGAFIVRYGAPGRRSDAREFSLSSSPSLRRCDPPRLLEPATRDSEGLFDLVLATRRLEALHDLSLLLLLTISLLLLPVAVVCLSCATACGTWGCW